MLEFIAHQPVNKGPDQSPGQVGYDQARLIIERGGEERAAYINCFREAHPQYRIQSIRSSEVEDRLDHSYNRGANKLQKDFNSETYYQQQTQAPINEGTRAGLEPHQLAHEQQDAKNTSLPKSQQQTEHPQSIRKAAEEFISNIEKKIEDGKKEIGEHQKPLQEEALKIEESFKKNPSSSSIDSFNPPMS